MGGFVIVVFNLWNLGIWYRNLALYVSKQIAVYFDSLTWSRILGKEMYYKLWYFCFIIKQTTFSSLEEAEVHMVIMNFLTLYFPKAKFGMLPVSQDILYNLYDAELKEAQSKWCLHFYWPFHGGICCDGGQILMVCLLFSKGSPMKRHRAAQGYPSRWYNPWSVLRQIQLQPSGSLSVLMKSDSTGHRKAFFFFFSRLNWQRAISCLIICFHLSSTKSYFRSRGKILRCKNMMILLFY